MAASTHFPRLVGSEMVDCVAGRPHVGVDPKAQATTTATFVCPSFDDVYREHFAFVWRSAKRLGVREASVDDVVQEVFVIVHRRLADFEGRSSLKTWLFGIALRVARDQKRSTARKSPEGSVDPDMLRATSPTPSESFDKSEAVKLLYSLLDELSDDRREVFVMAELEQMAMPDIAPTLGINVNTAYARLRAARQDFEAALERHRVREEWQANHVHHAHHANARQR